MLSLTAVALVLLVGWLVKKLIVLARQHTARLTERVAPLESAAGD